MKLWELDTPGDFQVLDSHTDDVLVFAVSPNNRHLATGSRDGGFRIWDLQTGRPLFTQSGDVRSLTFCPPDGNLLAVAGLRVRIYDLERFRRIHDLAIPKRKAESLACSPDGRRLVVGWDQGWITVFDPSAGASLLDFRAHDAPVLALAVSPDGTTIASGAKTTISLWDLKTGHFIRNLVGHVATIRSIEFFPDGRRLVSGGLDNTPRIWNVKSGTPILRLRGHNGNIFGVTVSSDGRRVATACWDMSVRLFDSETGWEILSFVAHDKAARAVDFSPDGKALISSGDDGRAIVWPAFAWQPTEYQVSQTGDLSDGIEAYKRAYWDRKLAAIRASSTTMTVTRSVDTCLPRPDSPFQVKIDIQTDAHTEPVRVCENLPEGWAATEVSHGGQFLDGTIRWRLSNPEGLSQESLRYKAVPKNGFRLEPIVLGPAVARTENSPWYQIEDLVLMPVPPGVLCFQQGTLPDANYDGGQDAQIERNRSNGNAGRCPWIEEGDWDGTGWSTKKILIRFNLPTGLTTFPLERAELRLYNFGERRAGFRNSHTVYAARLLRPWEEGDEESFDGELANRGNATYLSARHNEDLWEIPGALGRADVAEAESSATAGVDWPEWITLDVTESVRYFLANPDKNFGWKISQDPVRGVKDSTIKYVSGAYQFVSNQASEICYRPMLILVPSERATATIAGGQ